MISKTKFLRGLQCHKLLWLDINEPNSPELKTDTYEQLRGREVGDHARSYFPGGILIQGETKTERVQNTLDAISHGASILFEAAFDYQGSYCQVDVLHKDGEDFVITEAKSALSIKDENIIDSAFQLYVVRQFIPVCRVELMFLNKECQYPNLTNLFSIEDITDQLTNWLDSTPNYLDIFHKMLSEPMPDIKPGDQCEKPYQCPFYDRCNPKISTSHISNLYRIRKDKVNKLIKEGYSSIEDLPLIHLSSDINKRQAKSIKENKLFIEPSLKDLIQSLAEPIAFFDLEAITPPVPKWNGTSPYQKIPVQFSCHTLENGNLSHSEWLLDSKRDPRKEILDKIINVLKNSKTIMFYYAPFELSVLKDLFDFNIEHSIEFNSIKNKVIDLLQVIQNHIYHPDFEGSFSIKKVLPVLVPELSYKDLEIKDGLQATIQLEKYLFDKISKEEKNKIRSNALEYNKLDTLAMVKLFLKLKELSLC